MDVPQPSSPEQVEQPQPAPVADPRLQPTPDYGTLGPGSDVAVGGPGSAARPPKPTALALFLAAAIGVILAILVSRPGSAHTSWPGFANLFPSGSPASAAPTTANPRQLDRLKPQKQAEALLELAVGHSDGAVEQISSRVDRWQGKLKWDSQMATLTTAALNSNDMRVRESGVEVELAAYGLSRNSASLGYLLRSAESPDHSQKIWALWALGLMGNRGVETARVVQVLTAHLKDTDEESRRWTVEGLAVIGTDESIPLLLTTMHDDPSPLVRERAACSVAESGMFTHKQRLSAVPQLLNYTADATLDAQTHAWAYQALGDITKQRLPNDPAAWRSWYEENGGQ
jgi:HEAT repeats